jgi:hypothetical protein
MRAPAASREELRASVAPLPEPLFGPLDQAKATYLTSISPATRADLAVAALDHLAASRIDDPNRQQSLAHLITTDVIVRDTAAVLTRARQDRLHATQDRLEAERAESRGLRYLPRSGEHGPAALRTPIRFRVPKHQDTSATRAGAYPFLAEGGLGAAGVFVGRDLHSGSSFVYDPWVLYDRGLITAPNMVVAGIVGAGKSALAKSLYLPSLAFGRKVYIPCDPKGEYAVISRACSTVPPPSPSIRRCRCCPWTCPGSRRTPAPWAC